MKSTAASSTARLLAELVGAVLLALLVMVALVSVAAWAW